MTTRYYDEVRPVLLQKEEGYVDRWCYPLPRPGIGIPDPDRRGRVSFPDPLTVNIYGECKDVWVRTKEEKWGTKTEKWMSGYMKCTDTCTGEVKNHPASDRLVNDPVKF